MDKLENVLYWAVGAMVLVVGGLYLTTQFQSSPQGFGSVTQGNDYNSTSTPFDIGQASGQIDTGSGSLGSVIVTSPGNLMFRLLDATTTEAGNRPIETQATSTAEIAVISAATVGTYVFDVSYNYGLYLDIISGADATTTITFR